MSKTMTKEQKDLSLTSAFQFGEKEEDYQCEEHGKNKVKIFCLNGKWTAPYCKICSDKKQADQAERERLNQLRKDEETKANRIQSALNRAMIPERFKSHSFDTFIDSTDDQKAKKKHCLGYAKNFDAVKKAGMSMIFCGTTGTGKTHLACSIANNIIQQGNTSVFISVLRAIRQVKETYARSNTKTEQEAINWFLSPDLLILDEVGVQFGTDAEKMILFEIINERYQNMKPTILISNLNPQAIKEYVGDRVMDRMKENGGKLLKFEWESNRGSK